jgi:large subunit ribosomal protein L25
MPDVTLTAEPRTERGSGPAGRLRRTGKVPAVVYGLEAEPQSVSVVGRELERILHGEGGANTLITLHLGTGDDALALVRQIQRNPTRGDLVHVDFVRVRRDVAVSAEVPLHAEGDPPGVREGGMLEQLLFSVTVEAMPGNIPNSLTIDVSGLALGDQLHVSDLAVPAGVTLQHEAEELIVQVAIPRGMDEGEEGEGEEGEGEEGEGGEGGEGGGASADASAEDSGGGGE